MRFAVVCLMTATDASYSRRYGVDLDNSPSIQNTHALTGERNNNAYNRAIINDIRRDRITNVHGSGKNGPSSVYNGNNPLHQHVG